MNTTDYLRQRTLPAIELNPQIYTTDSEELMKQRGILRDGESMREALTRVTGALLHMDEELSGHAACEFGARVIALVNDGVIVYGTPVLTHAGRSQEMTAACTVLPVRVQHGKVDIKRFTADSYTALEKSLGTGYDLSEIERPAEALVELNHSLDRINTTLIAQNQRPVASMATLRADHPEILEFIRAKRDVDFSRWRFNISVFVTETLFEVAERREPWNLNDNHGATVGSIDANELLREIADSAHYCGEPGILFKDRINADNPTPQWEYISTAPCAEVAMAAGEACQFSYINVAFFAAATGFDTEGFGEAVRVVTRLLDASVEYTIRNHGALLLPLVAQKRRIGVGITGFADLLIRMGVPYDSRAAVDVAAQISELLDYHSKAESVELARARGAFPAFRVSRFLVPEWRARKLPRSTGVIAREDWERLLSAISHVGIRHASTTAMPPTGTSSEIVGSSKSLEPYFALTEQQGKVHRVVREALRNHPDQDVAAKILETLTDGESASLDSAALAHIPYLETARQISPWAHLAIQAGFQRFLDEAMAKTINLPESATPGDVLQSLWMAYRYHLKGLTVFRDNCLENRGASHG